MYKCSGIKAVEPHLPTVSVIRGLHYTIYLASNTFVFGNVIMQLQIMLSQTEIVQVTIKFSEAIT